MDHARTLLPTFGRLLISSLFLWSGIRKLGHPAAVIGVIGHSLPFPTLGLAISLACELGAATLLLLGWRTRSMALILALFTMATAVAFHHDFGDRDQLTNFMKNLAITGGLLQVMALGGGILSLDNRRVPAAV